MKPRMKPRMTFALSITVLALIVTAIIAHASSATQAYPFGSSQFTQFVNDSERVAPVTNAPNFQSWWRERFKQNPHPDLPGDTLEAALEARGKTIRAESDPSKRAQLESQTGAQLHALVKKLIPKFSLERGFELTNTVTKLERQCLLQSVLIAGMLQRAGIDAGAVMVWKNQTGGISNLGHVVVVLKRSDGLDILVDASDPTPFMRHAGLFGLVNGKLQFVMPTFSADATISGYMTVKDSRAIKPLEFQTLSNAYLRSQFFYYRGERASGGFMGNPSTPAGLEESAKFLRESIKLEPNNPLAEYVLGHVYRKLGRMDEAKVQYTKGYGLYLEQGFVPQGPQEAMTIYGQKP
jgi:hypothetical protein